MMAVRGNDEGLSWCYAVIRCFPGGCERQMTIGEKLCFSGNSCQVGFNSLRGCFGGLYESFVSLRAESKLLLKARKFSSQSFLHVKLSQLSHQMSLKLFPMP
jgi:hypothetical protein